MLIRASKAARYVRAGTFAFALSPFLYASPALAVYVQTNLVSSVPGLAALTDPDLVNAWGIAHSGTSPWWVADNGTAKSTLYTGAGAKQGLVVTIPGDDAAPTGMVFNPNSASFGGSRFIFAGEDGHITAWSSANGTTAVTAATSAGSVYKGLAIGNNGTAHHLYATDFVNGRVDVYDSGFSKVSLPGNFTDPNLPAGYGPFGIQNLGGHIFVTYAKQSGTEDEVDGPHLGFVSEFDANGHFIQRIASQGTLNAPWGITQAPGNFGPFSNALLIGNFGDGTINAFDPVTHLFEGRLHDVNGILQIEGLWGLGFGNGGNAGPTDSLFFAAGIEDEAEGLFGDIRFASVPEPSTFAIFAAGLLALFRLRRRALKVVR